MFNRSSYNTGYQQEDELTREARRLLNQYNDHQLTNIWNEVTGRLKFMQDNERNMDSETYYHAQQSYPKLMFQYNALKRAQELIEMENAQKQNPYHSSYNSYNSGTHLNTGITKVTQTGFGGNRYNNQDRQPTRPGSSRYQAKEVYVQEAPSPTEQSVGIYGSGRVSSQPQQPTQQEKQPITSKGDFTMANTVRGSVYPYACLNNKINTDGKTLGFELNGNNENEYAELLAELKSGGLTIKVHPDLVYFAFKSDNSYKSFLASNATTSVIEPMKNLIETVSEALSADYSIVEAKITDILSELLRREGVFNIEDTLSREAQMGDEDWELIDNHISGKDASIRDLAPLATMHKNFNFAFKTKDGIYTYLYRMMTSSSSLVNGVFADNVFEVFANLEGTCGYAFLDFLNKKNFEKFVVTKECNSPLYYILEEAYKGVKESNSIVSKISNFCNLSLRISDETGFEYRILVESDFMKEAFYVSNANNAVLVNQVYANNQGENDDKENAE